MNKKGETITEALVSTLIIAIVFVGMNSAIMASSRINNKAINHTKPFHHQGTQSATVKVFIERNGTKTDVNDANVNDANVNVYVYIEEDTGYYYYE